MWLLEWNSYWKELQIFDWLNVIIVISYFQFPVWRWIPCTNGLRHHQAMADKMRRRQRDRQLHLRSHQRRESQILKVYSIGDLFYFWRISFTIKLYVWSWFTMVKTKALMHCRCWGSRLALFRNAHHILEDDTRKAKTKLPHLLIWVFADSQLKRSIGTLNF